MGYHRSRRLCAYPRHWRNACIRDWNLHADHINYDGFLWNFKRSNYMGWPGNDYDHMDYR
jgi:hypothetical protein